MELMECRMLVLKETLAAFEQTGVPFLRPSDGGFLPCNLGDDMGIYYFIPLLCRTFHLPLQQGLDLFFSGLLFGSLFLGLSGLLLLYRNHRSLLVAALFVLPLVYFLFYTNDVYFIPPAVTFALVPLGLWLLTKDRKPPLSLLLVFLSAAGVLVGLADFCRIHAGTGLFLFFLVLLLFRYNGTWKEKAFLVSALVVGLAAASLFSGLQFRARDEYLRSHGYDSSRVITRHVFWHSVYIGLGFLSNPYGITWSDTCASQCVKKIAPGVDYLSPEYERVLRNEVFRLVRSDRDFVSRTIFAKVGALLFYLALFAHFGLVAAFTRPAPLPLQGAFWAALLFSAIPGLLAVPTEVYMLGYISLAALYGMVCANHALLEGRRQWS